MTDGTKGDPKPGAKPASMTSVFARKGDATPASDSLNTQDKIQPKPVSPDPTDKATSKMGSNPAQPSAPGNELATLLNALHEAPIKEDVLAASKVIVNVKLSQDLERKLKRIVGFEKARRMSNFSQQDWLESRLELIINHEFSNLPRFK